jgi:hypothetical protein
MRCLRVPALLCGLVVGTCLCGTLRAQQVDLWQGVGLTAKLGKGWSFTLEDQVRFDLDAPRYRSSLLETTVRKKVLPWLRLGVGYRLRLNPDEWQHRAHLDALFSYAPEKIPFEFRGLLRYQHEWATWDSPASMAFRQRFIATWNATKTIHPFLYLEGQLRSVGGGAALFDRTRSGVGVQYDVSKRNSLELLYFYQAPFQRDTRVGTHVISLAFELTLDWSKKAAQEPEPR